MWKHWSVPVCLCDNVQTEKLKRKVVKGAETVEAVRTEREAKDTINKVPEGLKRGGRSDTVHVFHRKCSTVFKVLTVSSEVYPTRHYNLHTALS